MSQTCSIDPEILLLFLEDGAIYCKYKGTISVERKKTPKQTTYIKIKHFKVYSYIVLMRIPIHGIPTVHDGTVKTLEEQTRFRVKRHAAAR